jgi:hypothetical protein
MKFHPIFQPPFRKWWSILFFITALKYAVLGFPMKFANAYYPNEKHSLLFWTLGCLLSSLTFGSILYLVVRLFLKKWDNKVFMICISIVTIIYLILIN